MENMYLDGYQLYVKDAGRMIRFYFLNKRSGGLLHLVKDGTLLLRYGRKDYEEMTGKRFE